MQTEAKFTPGPWRYAPTNSGHMIAGAKPGYLAEVRDCGSGKLEANVALILASPDLLAALIGLRDWYEDFTGLPAAEANAAIRKAHGEV